MSTELSPQSLLSKNGGYVYICMMYTWLLQAYFSKPDFQQWEQAGISEEHVKKRVPGCNLAPLNEQLQGENPGNYSWSRFPW